MAIRTDYRITDDLGDLEDVTITEVTDHPCAAFSFQQGSSEILLTPTMFEDLLKVMGKLEG